MGRDHLGWFESEPDSQWWKDWMCKEGNSMVQWEGKTHQWDIHGFKNPVGLRPTSSNDVKNYLHQVILWHNSAYKGQSCIWPLGVEGTQGMKMGEAGSECWQWTGVPSLYDYQGWCQQAAHCSDSFSRNFCTNLWSSSRDVATFLPKCSSYTRGKQ